MNDFDSYLQGEMNAKERDAFEARLQDEPALHDALDQHRAALESIRRNRLRADIAAIGQRVLRRQTWWRYGQVAALLLLLATTGAGVWFLTKPEPPPVPPAPVAHIPQPGESLSGAAASTVFEQKNTARGIRITDGQPAPDAAATYHITVLGSPDHTTRANVQGTDVLLFFPADQMPQPAQIWLIELHQTDRFDLFLQNGDTFYHLREGQQELMPVTDTGLLEWLK